MKKMILAAVATVILATGCGANTTPNTVSLYDKGLEMAQMLDKMAEDDTYFQLFSQNDALKQIVQKIGSQDYTTPKAVYAVTGAGEILLQMADLPEDATLQKVVEQKTSSVWTTQINGIQGAEFLAATSILFYDESFVYEGLQKPTTYLYTYDGEYSVAVTYIPYENSVVKATTSILKADASVLDMLKQIPGVTIEEVKQ